MPAHCTSTAKTSIVIMAMMYLVGLKVGDRVRARVRVRVRARVRVRVRGLGLGLED